MIQEIEPLHLDNQYHPTQPGPRAKALAFRERSALVSRREDALVLPGWAQLEAGVTRWVYLFHVGETDYFLVELRADFPLPEGFFYDDVRSHRHLAPRDAVYAEMTAWHLYVWYRDNRFCGRCGAPVRHDARLRMLACPVCDNVIFPKICPAIIAAVVHDDKILLTRYAGRAYKSYALVAGFTEIGETAEDTVRREVFEETGLRVKNLRYWATQPWGIECDLLIGYFCELDGAEDITLDRDELSMAGWYSRDELDIPADDVSLTNDMIRAFIEGRNPR